MLRFDRERGFADRLGQRRVSAGGAGDVLGAGAELDREDGLALSSEAWGPRMWSPRIRSLRPSATILTRPWVNKLLLRQDAAQRERKKWAAILGRRSRVNTPLKFIAAARLTFWPVLKSAKAHTCIPAMNRRAAATSR